jgi:methyl-accepting chemotaxis protein
MKKKWLSLGLGLSLGTAGIMVIHSLLQIQFIPIVPGDATAVKALVLRISLINILIAVLGFLLLSAGIRIPLEKLSALEHLLRPLKEKNFRAFRQPSNQEKKDDSCREIEEALASLGKFFETLEDFLVKHAGIKESLRAESREGDAIISHIEGEIEEILSRFYEIESSAVQALSAVSGIENYFNSLKTATDEQSLFMNHTEDHLTQAAEAADSVASRLNETTRQVETLAEALFSGEEQSRAVYKIIKNISQNMEKIAEMLLTINGISEQTNILSMNAAIESAHAGSAGAGFAVVADEIKKLAESTKDNAQNIQEEISGITKQMRDALKAGEASSETLNAVTGEIKRFSEGLAGIAAEALKSGAANEDIRTAVKNFAVITQKIKDGSADIMAHQQSFRAALELIHSLSDKTRTEIKEIHSGTKEILEKIRRTQEKVLQNLEETGNLKKILPGGLLGALPDQEAPPALKNAPALPEPPSKSGKPAPPSKPADGSVRAFLNDAPRASAEPAGASARADFPLKENAFKTRPGSPEKEEYSAGREITVKQAPHTIR